MSFLPLVPWDEGYFCQWTETELQLYRIMTKCGLGTGLIAVTLASSLSSAHGQAYSVEMHVVTHTDNQAKDEIARISLATGSKFRVEQVLGPNTRIIIVNDTEVWNYDPATKTGLHAKQSSSVVTKLKAQGSSGLLIYSKFLKSGGKSTGMTMIDGQNYPTFQYKDANNMIHRLSIFPGAQHLPRRLVEDGVMKGAVSMGAPMQSHILKRQTDFSRWTVGSSPADSLFHPPAGITFTEAPAAPATPGKAVGSSSKKHK